MKTSSIVPLKKFLDSLPEVPILTLFERIVVAGARAENTSTPSRYPVTIEPLKVAARWYHMPVVTVELRPASNTVFPDASDVLKIGRASCRENGSMVCVRGGIEWY